MFNSCQLFNRLHKHSVSFQGFLCILQLHVFNTDTMRKLYTFFFFFLISGVTFIAQAQQPDYRIRLNAGDFIPAENMATLKPGSAEFREGLFAGKIYGTIQFYTLPTQADKDRMLAAGIQLLDYIPNLAYTVGLAASVPAGRLSGFGMRSYFRFTAAQKTVPALLAGTVPAHATKQPGYADITVITYEKMPVGKIAGSLYPLSVMVIEEQQVFRSLTLRVPVANLRAVVELPFIQWAEFIDPPNQLENTLGRTLHRVSVLNDGVRNLKGDGINVGIWDEGEISPHLDFSPSGRLVQVETSSPSLHSTHCAGTILGRGLINQTARGMAPNAKLYSYNFNGSIQSEMATAIPANNLVVSSHSYGSTQTCGLNGAGVTYSATSRATDLNLNNFPFHLHAHSAGNSQTACSGGWSTITASGKSAKNNILVANITTLEAISGSSSFGPVQDGRVKPEISAFGTSVFSTATPQNAYATLSGTSMATPGVAGTLTLLVQRYKQLNSDNLPPSTLIKNTVLNTAQDLGNTGPDYKFGYGRLDALQAVRILEENRYALSTISTGNSNDHTITVPAGTARLKVMLTWNDPAGTANANPALVNNLDLSVINGATTSLPWVLDPLNPANPATTGVDNVSNIEQVVILNPPAGTYTLRVGGTAITTGPSQDYAITWNIDQPFIELTYPNGGETFNTSSSETITWDNAGIAGTQTVEYSLNGGSSWTTISNTVPAFTTRLAWSVPSGVNTSTALIRITAGSISDQSDAHFNILGTVAGFGASGVSCNPGEVVFNWAAVNGATQYDIYTLDNATGDFTLFAGNITGTTYTATGLTPNALMWFTIRAKSNTTNAISQRANAVSVVVSNGGAGLGTVGAITGLGTVCGNPSNVTYSISPVSGATSYTWSAPPGATISGGQGSTQVTVNYISGSTSGNLSVYASNGACNTTPALLPVTVGSTAIAAPVSGGNQSAVVCPGNTTPTLTATASTASGTNLVWYDQPAGGSVVVNPVLQTAGSVTYYAAAVENSTGCVSVVRTPVSLTITAVPAAAVTADGPTTFCEGGNVLLTAGNGSQYSWSNGATTQSILVTASGNYSVTVTTNGCTSTSPVTPVVVNALPAAVITANGPTSFCQGGSVVLSAGAGTSWLWSNGATSQSITVSASGNYTVTVSSDAGCSKNADITTVTVSPSPVVSLSAAPYTNLYPGLTTTLTSTVSPAGSYSYTWRKNTVVVTGANAASLNNIGLDDIGSYSVTVTNSTGLACSNTSNIQVIGDSATTKLFILPNPSAGEFEVVYYSGANNSYTLTLADGKGAVVYRKTYTINTPYQRMAVDMRRHNSGIYTLLLTDRNGKRLATGKVLIQQ